MEDSNTGHHRRLKERFDKGGIKALHDYEIVELLLTYVISRQDTKPRAKKLLKRFGSITGILNADEEQLKSVSGIGNSSALFLKFIREFSAYSLNEKIKNGSVISNRANVEEYLRFHFGYRKDEYVAVLFMDTGNRVIISEVIAEGTVNQCTVYPRVVIGKAIKNGAASFILVHNHPGGSMEPSTADWAITDRMYDIGRLMELPLLDHIIVHGGGTVSLCDFPRWPGK